MAKNYATSSTYGKPLTQERLLQVLRYSKETGEFTWLVGGRGRFMRQGAIAGRVSRWGYLIICVDGATYMAHRLAWLYVTGEWPENEIDHLDADKLNNRLENLRDVSRSVNLQNVRRARACSKTGVLGVSPTKHGKFVATLQHAGKQVYLGRFDTVSDGHRAYVAAKRELHEGCTL